MKKITRTILAALLASAVLVGVQSCGPKGSPEKTDKAPESQGSQSAENSEKAEKKDNESKAGEKAKVAFITADMANPSQAYSSKMFEKYAADYNLELTVLDAKGDVQQESQLVNNSIAQGFKAIYLNPNDVNAIIPSVKQAHEAGIIVGLFSADLPEQGQQYRDFFCGVNDTQAGEEAGKAIMKQFPDGAKIVEIGGQAGHDAQIKRHDGFNKAIEGSNIEVIDYQAVQQWDTAQAMAIMEDMITKHGKDIKAVFCHWDNGVTGCIEALKAANMSDIFVVGVDGNKSGFAQVKEGTQQVCISQSFSNMSKKSLELTRDVLDGKKVEPINYIPLDVVTKDNIDQFPTPEW